MALVPNSRPKMSASDVERILKAKGIDRAKYPVCVLAVRGYYLDTMGAKGKNDRGIFDDAAFVCSPTLFSAVNWNTDPSSYRKGRGAGSGKGMASLKLGSWDYQIGQHKQIFPAGVQAGKVTVIRDGLDGDYEDTGYFGINLHPGGAGTSSLGCQTAPKAQFPSFIQPLIAELKRYGKKVFKYVLIDAAEMNTILKETAPALDQPTLPAEPLSLEPALDLIAEFEGLRLKAYKDPVGIPTIGYGTIKYPSGKKVQLGDTCTAVEAVNWLLDHIEVAILPALNKMCTVRLSVNEYCALVSFTYNLGAGALKGSTLMKKLNAGESRAIVAKEFDKWVKAGGKTLPGLVRRRASEKELFLKA